MKETKFNSAIDLFPTYVIKSEKVLSLGCGSLKVEYYFNANVIIGVEWADMYMDMNKDKKGVIMIKADIKDICNIFPDKSFDSVILYDVLEHLLKEDAIKLLTTLENKIKNQIIIFTPIQGEIENIDEIIKIQEQRKKDGLPLGHHLSSWTPEEFSKMGYVGEYNTTYHVNKGWGAIFAVKNLDI